MRDKVEWKYRYYVYTAFEKTAVSRQCSFVLNKFRPSRLGILAEKLDFHENNLNSSTSEVAVLVGKNPWM